MKNIKAIEYIQEHWSSGLTVEDIKGYLNGWSSFDGGYLLQAWLNGFSEQLFNQTQIKLNLKAVIENNNVTVKIVINNNEDLDHINKAMKYFAKNQKCLGAFDCKGILKYARV